MKIREIFSALEHFAPLSLQESYDNAGLQFGLTGDAELTGALVCLDVTEDVVAEAERLGCNLIVSHHPLLFRPLRRVSGTDYVGRTLVAAVKANIALYAAHTNLDNAAGGVCATMAERLGLRDCRPLIPVARQAEGAGSGLVGVLPDPLKRELFLRLVKERFGVSCLRCNAWTGETVRRVALCGGAGASLIGDAEAAGADAFVTGEVGYHRFFGLENQLLVCEIGHYESEQFAVALLHKLVSEAAPQCPVHETQLNTNPVHYL